GGRLPLVRGPRRARAADARRRGPRGRLRRLRAVPRARPRARRAPAAPAAPALLHGGRSRRPRQQVTVVVVEDVLHADYGCLPPTGRAPSAAELAELLGGTPADAEASLRRLHDARHVVLDDGAIVMAHPFAAVPLGFAVMGRDTLWWGGC